MRNQYLKDLIFRLEQVTRSVDEAFGMLNKEQLNWKPAPDRWSIGQCLDHLMVSNKKYFPQLEKIIAGTKRPTIWERLPVVPGLWGKMLLKTITPEPKTKMKTPRIFLPSHSYVSADIVDHFKEHNAQLISLMERSDELDHSHLIITSPAGSFITYSLEDAFHILTNHEERHVKQGKKVLEMPEFPFFE